MSNKIVIFDTTLRDGEQSPGCSMNLKEKLEMAKQLERLKVKVECSVDIQTIQKIDDIFIINSQNSIYKSKNIILATGGLGYPTLGATGDGYIFAKEFGHEVTSLHPAMMPLFTKEKNFAVCKADTIAKAILKVDLPN